MKLLPKTSSHAPHAPLSVRALSLTRAELLVYQDYDRQRQRRLLTTLLPPSMLLMALGSLISTVIFILRRPPELAAYLSYGALLLATMIFGAGIVALRRDQLRFATLAMVLGGTVGFLLSVVPRLMLYGLDPYGLSEFIAFGTIIVLAGVLAGYRAIIVTTVLMNGTTLFVLFALPRAPGMEPLVRPELAYLTPTALVFQWIVAVVVLANRATYLQTLRALGTAVERAHQLDLLKDQFITHVNHELRTPIMTLHGYVEYLREARHTMSPDEEAAAFEKASRTGKSLVTLLSDILDVRRIDEQLESKPQIVPLRPALTSAATLTDLPAGTLEARAVQLQIPDDLAVWAEPALMHQILTNLLSNAFKYSAPGTPVEIGAHVVAQRHGGGFDRLLHGEQPPSMVEITVRDYGLGIPPDQIPLLFHRFVRLPRDLASRVMGNGLGLYLCRSFAEAMGGHIWAESTGVAGEGTTFHLLLPLPPSDDATPREPATSAQTRATPE